MYPESKIPYPEQSGSSANKPLAPETHLSVLKNVIQGEAKELSVLNRRLERIADAIFGYGGEEPDPCCDTEPSAMLDGLNQSINEVNYWRRKLGNTINRFDNLV